MCVVRRKSKFSNFIRIILILYFIYCSFHTVFKKRDVVYILKPLARGYKSMIHNEFHFDWWMMDLEHCKTNRNMEFWR